MNGQQIAFLILPVLGAILLYEFIPIKKTFSNLLKLNKKVMTIIFVSQLRKKKKKQLLQLLLLKILKKIIFLYSFILLISSPFILTIFLEQKLKLSISFFQFYSTIKGLILTSAIVVIYILLKKAFFRKN